MNPYRLALPLHTSSCLDPPRATCLEPPKKRRIEWLLGAGIGVALVTGMYASHAIGHGGHVEIAPAALAHARAHITKREPRRKTVPAATRAPDTTPHAVTAPTHAWLVGSHDAKSLTSRARQLASMGLDVTVVDVPLSNALAQWPDFRENSFPMDSVPVRDTASGHVDAIEIRGLPESSPLRVAGIANGDQLLGIDGYRLEDDSLRFVDVLGIRARGSMIVELARGGHHVVLSIHWKVKG